jgi:nucleoside phosphorylase
MALPTFVCFVPLANEMLYINERLMSRDPPAAYKSGRFDIQRPSHTYEIRTGKVGQSFNVKFFRLSGMGNIGTAAFVTSVLQQEDSKAAFIVGIAGSIDLDVVGLGDVVVATSARYLGPDKVQGLRSKTEAFHDRDAVEPEAKADVRPIDVRKRIGKESWLRFRRDAIEFDNGSRDKINAYLEDRQIGDDPRLSTVSAKIEIEADEGGEARTVDFSNTAPKIVSGAILGSEWVVDSREFLGFLMDRTDKDTEDWYKRYGGKEGEERNFWLADDTLALDMETYGFFTALKTLAARSVTRPHGYAFRGISDPCKDKHALDGATKEEVRRIAAHNAIDSMVSFIEYYRMLDKGA